MQAVGCVMGLLLTQSLQDCIAVSDFFVNRAALIKKYRVHDEILAGPSELDLTNSVISQRKNSSWELHSRVWK